MKNLTAVLILSCLLVVSCAPGQTSASTIVPSQIYAPPPTTTNTALPPHTSTPTRTATPTLTFTLTPPIQSNTPTPFPNLGIKASDVIDGMWFLKDISFVDIPDIEGQVSQRAEILEDSTTITVIGEPYLTRAELRIDVSKLRDIDILNMYIITFVMSTAPDGGFEAQDWARHSLSEAAQKGKIEKSFGKSKIIIEIEDGKILNITAMPADDL